MSELARRLTLPDILCLGVNAIIGSGIFLFPGKLAGVAGPTSVLAFLLCGFLLITVALCYAEMAGLTRRNGGSYVYALTAFGRRPGFVVGWLAWVTAIFSWAGVANAISSQLAWFHPIFENWTVTKLMACTLILGFGTINYFGVRMGAMTVNLFTLAKTVPLAIFVGFGLFHLRAPAFAGTFASDVSTLSAAVFLSLWPLQGFETTPIIAGESKNPQRDVPLATIGSLLLVAGFYTLIQVVAVGTLPGLAASKKPLADAAATFLGPLGATLMAAGAAISMTGYSAGNALGSARYLEALAEDRFLPQSLKYIHPRYLTPARAIVVTTALTAVMAIWLDFSTLVDISNLAVISQYASTCLAVIWLRLKAPQLERRFRVPGGLVLPLAALGVSLWLIKQVRLPEVVFTVSVVLVGVALALLTHALERRRAAT
jgi:APA family basic amino acid/polyamine antiporter